MKQRGSALVLLLVVVVILVIAGIAFITFARIQNPDTNSHSNTNSAALSTIAPLRLPSASPTPAPQQQASYTNPFDENTQYTNPFDQNQNPFNDLQ